MQKKKPSIKLVEIALLNHPMERKKLGLTQNKPLEVTEGETSRGQRLDVA